MSKCILPISCTIQTEQDSSPKDDDMGASAGQTLMDKLDKMEGLHLDRDGSGIN
jgi:hypothetical protein